MSNELKEFTVGTFFHPDGKARGGLLPKRLFTAYTLWYSPDWKGCIEYVIKARSGKEARCDAIEVRRDRERIRQNRSPVDLVSQRG